MSFDELRHFEVGLRVYFNQKHRLPHAALVIQLKPLRSAPGSNHLLTGSESFQGWAGLMTSRLGAQLHQTLDDETHRHTQ